MQIDTGEGERETQWNKYSHKEQDQPEYLAGSTKAELWNQHGPHEAYHTN